MAPRKGGLIMVCRTYLFLFLFCLVSLTGCASQSVMLVHPQSGSTMRCGAAGVGFMAGGVEGFVEGCLKRYENKGYVRVKQLTPEQRADLERRGVLPKPDEPPLQTGY